MEAGSRVIKDKFEGEIVKGVRVYTSGNMSFVIFRFVDYGSRKSL